MKLGKLPKKKPVTISQILHQSDKNEANDTIIDIIEEVESKCHRFGKIFICAEYDSTKEQAGSEGLCTWGYGFADRDMCFIAELIKTKAMMGFVGQMICDSDDDENDNGGI
jgi:hypothetical protein